jgi:nucleotide-binding universal stress UspA family protein
MVSIDESENAHYAFQFACANLNKEHDHLYIVSVAQDPSVYLYMLGDVSHLAKRQRKLTKRVLAFYKKEAEAQGIICTMILGQSRDVGDTLCMIAERLHVHHLALGRRSMTDLQRLLVGSTSKHVVEHANCNVAVVKPPTDVAESERFTDEKLGECFKKLHVKTSGISTIVEDDKAERDRILKREKEGKTYLYIFRTIDEPLKRKDILISEHKGESREILDFQRLSQREKEKYGRGLEKGSEHKGLEEQHRQGAGTEERGWGSEQKGLGVDWGSDQFKERGLGAQHKGGLEQHRQGLGTEERGVGVQHKGGLEQYRQGLGTEERGMGVQHKGGLEQYRQGLGTEERGWGSEQKGLGVDWGSEQRGLGMEKGVGMEQRQKPEDVRVKVGGYEGVPGVKEERILVHQNERHKPTVE